jgi:hypothetical protein
MEPILLMFALKLMFVQEIHENDAGAVITFQGGAVGQLPKQGNDKYAQYLDCARDGLKNRFPVAVTLGEDGRVVTMHWAGSDTVHSLQDHDGDRLEVDLSGHAAMYYLRKDHPDLPRVKGVLEQSAKGHSQVWLSFDIHKMLVLDAVPVEERGKK